MAKGYKVCTEPAKKIKTPGAPSGGKMTSSNPKMFQPQAGRGKPITQKKGVGNA